jgi:hypothetical protein
MQHLAHGSHGVYVWMFSNPMASMDSHLFCSVFLETMVVFIVDHSTMKQWAPHVHVWPGKEGMQEI